MMIINVSERARIFHCSVVRDDMWFSSGKKTRFIATHYYGVVMEQLTG